MSAAKDADKLAPYRAKRKPGATPEPFGATAAPGSRFVVQLHAASRRHYDFRLEHEGVLVSWAVPKGPSLDPADKRLAVHVEDHPLDYIYFEGTIPEGNYGAGAVIVWDRGRWEPVKDFNEGLESGKLLFDLFGYKLRGRFTLVKTKRSPKDWLLIKERDSYVRTGDAASLPADSVLSGRTVEQLGAGEDPGIKLAEQCRKAGAKRSRLAFKDAKPMLATPGQAFSHKDWVFEIKYDGYRLLGGKEKGEVKLISRNSNDFTAVFPDIAEVLAALPYDDFLLDGEVVVHDAEGLPSFAGLQQRGRLTREADISRAAVQWPATLYAFDLLSFGEYDLRQIPLFKRKQLLAELLPTVGPIRLSEHIEKSGEAMFEQLKSLGLEGIVGKRKDSPYVGRRSPDWIKVSARTNDDFAVVGYSPGKNRRADLGALLLAQRGAQGWVYAGRVGGGFSDADLKTFGERLAAAKAGGPPHDPEQIPGARWIEPAFVVEVQFKRRTPDGRLRQPVFVALREDKAPEDCWLPGEEKPLPEAPVARKKAAPAVEITNPDKVFWPDEGYTKKDLLDYYRAVAPYLLPYLRDRPLVLTRYPDGIKGKSFYQKDAPEYAPGWLRLETLWSEGSEREIRYFVIESEEGLAYIANMAAIPLHIWSSRMASLQQPDWCILDLDPKGAPFAHVVQVARAIHKVCDAVGLPHFVKTSGSTGLHVLIPLGARYTHEQSRAMAEILANWVVKELPDIATVQRHLDAREGKVYVDYLQNGHGRLLVAPYSVRPVPGATVSMPLDWKQVTSKLDMHRYTLRTVPALLAKQKSDPFAGLFTEVAHLPESLGRLSQVLGGPLSPAA
ncbi:MAG: DNA ligase D [Gammaproteobacteria bacterium]|nr:DNA ligase D [Gammaproteobacteria bacterium]